MAPEASVWVWSGVIALRQYTNTALAMEAADRCIISGCRYEHGVIDQGHVTRQIAMPHSLAAAGQQRLASLVHVSARLCRG